MANLNKFLEAVELGYTPDAPQQNAILHPFNQPLLILAGAGSGKTETMANRIVYMLYKEHQIMPSDILGITFTNKAVIELKDRIRKRVKKLKNGIRDIQDYPEVMTYNSFATNIVSDFGIINGIDSDIRVITSADRHLLIKEAVLEYANEQFNNYINKLENDQASEDDIPKINVDSYINSVANLIDELDNNLLEEQNVEDFIDEIVANFDPDGLGRRGKNSKKGEEDELTKYQIPPLKAKTDKKEIIKSLKEKKPFLEIIKKYRKLKIERKVMDFADQVKMAVKIAKSDSKVCEYYRNRFKYVILDEYQDTSASQVELLKTIFGKDFPIVAVGDPNQAIYEWRGASSSGILRFPEHFSSNSAQCKKIELLTSRRNSKSILKVANKVTKSLTNSVGEELVSELSPANNAKEGEVIVKLCATKEKLLEDISSYFEFSNETQKTNLERLGSEVETVVDYLKKNFAEHNSSLSENEISQKRTAAILCPKRSDFIIYKNALENAGIQVQVNGLSGLLELPEIQDILAYLYVANSSQNNQHMLRILTSPRVNINARQLKAIKSLATNEKDPETGEIINREGIIDVIKSIAIYQDGKRTNKQKVLYKKIGQEMYAKVERIGAIFNLLEKDNLLNLDEFVEKVIYFSNIETELYIHEEVQKATNPLSANQNDSISTVELFKEQVRDFAKYSTSPTLDFLLQYFEVAVKAENGFDQPFGKVNKDAVQLITIHGSKGLEWDIVCSVSNSMKDYLGISTEPYKKPTADQEKKGYIPQGLLAEFPNYKLGQNSGWLTKKDKLPDNLKLDKEDLQPLVNFSKIKNMYDYDVEISQFEIATSIRAINERRRLAYVAFTRAKTHLLITSSLYNMNNFSKTPQATLPTSFWIDAFTENGEDIKNLETLLKTIFIPIMSSKEESKNPRPLGDDRVLQWPFYCNDTNNKYHMATAKVAQELNKMDYSEIDQIENDNLLLLLEEKKQQQMVRDNWQDYVKIPQVLSTSALVKLSESKMEFLKNITRPVPQKPSFVNDIGTRFHNFAQDFFTNGSLERHIKGEYLYETDNKGELTIDKLVENFLKSNWSKRTPLDVEREINFLLNDHLIIARIDAIFQDEKNPDKVIIVDWKTGKPPISDMDKRNKMVQLANYREAYLKSSDLNPENVDAAFVYVREPNDTNTLMFSGAELDLILTDLKKKL